MRAEHLELRAERVELGLDVGDEVAEVLEIVPRALQDAIEARRIATDERLCVVEPDRRGRIAARPELEVTIGERALRRDEHVAAGVESRRLARLDRHRDHHAVVVAEWRRVGRERDRLDLADAATGDDERRAFVQRTDLMKVHAHARPRAPVDAAEHEHEERDHDHEHAERPQADPRLESLAAGRYSFQKNFHGLRLRSRISSRRSA